MLFPYLLNSAQLREGLLVAKRWRNGPQDTHISTLAASAEWFTTLHSSQYFSVYFKQIHLYTNFQDQSTPKSESHTFLQYWKLKTSLIAFST